MKAQSVWNRDVFLDDKSVRDFVDWFRGSLDSELLGAESDAGANGAEGGPRAAVLCPPFHKYDHRKPKYHWRCYGLFDAVAKYRFPIKNGISAGSTLRATPADMWVGEESLHANASVLDWLQLRLRALYSLGPAGWLRNPKAHDLAVSVAKDVQRWGGTTKGNLKAIDALHAKAGGFCHYLEQCDKVFGNTKSLDLKQFRSHGLRSNAGFTKIYSLLFDDFIIYDSRVAAALGKLTVDYATQRRLPAIPSELRWGWMPGRHPTIRNPSTGAFTFDQCHPNVPGRERHILSNVKANWILAASVAGTRFEELVKLNSHAMPVKPIRALEAALFMIGYDLAGNPPYP